MPTLMQTTVMNDSSIPSPSETRSAVTSVVQAIPYGRLTAVEV
ncbi:hypothetical protein ACPCTO_14550 [Streptomyces olivoreticuli]